MKKYLHNIPFLLVIFPGLLSAQLVVNYNFFPDYAYSGKTIQFTSQVTGGTPGQLVYDWDFDDGSAHSAIQNPTHIFNISGCGIQEYFVELKVTDLSNQNKDSVIKTVHVKKIHAPPPTADFFFTPDSVCSGTPIQFTSVVTGCDSNLFVFDWNFNDGTNHVSQRNPSHTFNPFGCNTANFNVILIITDTSNNSQVTAQATQTVHIKRRPDPQLLDTANSIPLNNCYNSPTPDDPDFRVKVINQTGNGSCIVANSYSIDWGDGTIMTGLSPSSFPIEHIFHQLGAYDLIYRAEGINGCFGETHYLVKNEGNPGGGIVSPGQTAGCVPKSFQFKVEGIQNNSPATTYTCDFDDGTPFVVWTKEEIYLNDTAFTHTFLQSSCSEPEGSFTVKLTATNSCKSTISTVDGVEIWSKGYTMIGDTLPIGCIGQCVWFTNISTFGNGPPNCSSNSTFYWEFGNGNTYNGFNPPCQYYNAPGVYYLKLISTSYCGNDTLVCPVTIYSLANAIAIPTPLNGCSPLEVAFDNQSTGDSIHYTWSVTPNTYGFINGTDSLSENPVIRFTGWGDYTVTLLTSNICSYDTAIFHIHVSDKPSATLPGVTGDCVPFIYSMEPEYSGNGSPVTWYEWHILPPEGWSYVPPTDSTSPAPVVRFDSAGLFTMRVFITNGCGTTLDSTNAFEVFPVIQAEAGPDTNLCMNSGNFVLRGYPPGGIWSGLYVVNDSIFRPIETGSFQLSYSIQGNCASTDSLIITVDPLPVVTAGADTVVCANLPPFLLNALPVGGIWTGNGIVDSFAGLFDPAQVVDFSVVTYTFTDTLTDCNNSDSLLVTVNPLPVLVVNDTTFCNQPVPEYLNAEPSGGTWSGLNVTPEGCFTPSGTGTFVLSYFYMDLNGCSSLDSIQVQVIDPDTNINAGADHWLCQNETLWLSGTPPGGRWSGDSVSVSGFFNPGVPGAYTVVYGLGSGSCLTTDTAIINVMSAPGASFLVDAVCLGDTTRFQDNSTAGENAIISYWNWDFGDGSFSQEKNPVHLYSGSGDFFVTLLTINSNGCRDSIVQTVTVHPLPDVSFLLDQSIFCTNTQYQFFNHTLNAVTYSWDFGDGDTSVLVEPLHAYSDPGSYTVKLNAWSEYGCFSSDTTTIFITPPPPDPVFTRNTGMGCGPLPVHLDIIDSLYQNTDATFYWDFGNGMTSNNLVPPDTLVYPAGVISDTIYYIRFSSANYCDSLTYADSVKVAPVPLIHFTMPHPWDCSPVTVSFRNYTVGKPGYFFWDLGDGNTSTEFEPVHTYTADSSTTTYTIRLISGNDCGTDTVTHSLTVRPNTVNAYFTVDSFIGCEGDIFRFHNFSSDTSNATNYNLTWDFGDGLGPGSQGEQNPVHQYNQEGTYIVTLRYDNFCSIDEAQDTIYVNSVPQVNISAAGQVCSGDTIWFTFGSDVAVATTIWYFGDGDSSAVNTPGHVYRQQGSYEVILKAGAATGFPVCTGTDGHHVEVKRAPEATISSDVTSGCAPLEITFQGDSGSFHLWKYEEGEFFTSDPTHIFENPGLYRVHLISEMNNMCRDEDSIEIRVLPRPVSGFTYTSSGGYPDMLTFTNTSTGATQCFWDFGNNIFSQECNVQSPVEYSKNKTYTITLTTVNQYGCYDSISIPYTTEFKGLFIPNAFAPEHPDPGANLFLPKGIGLSAYSIQVFDTWGNLIWESSALVDGSPSEGWNGRTSGGELYPQDVYVWKITARFTDGTMWSGVDGKSYGTVTLIW